MHALNDATIVVTSGDGDSAEVEIPAGATFWTAATTHSVENVGTETVRFIRVELKWRSRRRELAPQESE